MKFELSVMADRLVDAFRGRGGRQQFASLLIKIALIVGGSLIAGIAQFQIRPEGEPLSFWGGVGLVAVVAAGLGGLYTAILDHDASRELALAAEAVEDARQYGEMLEDIAKEAEKQNGAIERAIQLYLATSALRGAIEQSAGNDLDDAALAERLITIAARPLKLALDFRLDEHWTLTIYRTEGAGNERRKLKPLAFDRSMDCKVSEARVIPEGVGVAGICLSRNQEVIVPDISAERSGNMHEMGELSLPHDQERYRSLVAVPINVGATGEPWGIVCATSSRPNHFIPDGQPGIRTDEAARALAGMVALAVAAQHIRNGKGATSAAATPSVKEGGSIS